MHARFPMTFVNDRVCLVGIGRDSSVQAFRYRQGEEGIVTSRLEWQGIMS